jgi:two-component system nitrate/nitrite response regulator NarL
MPNVDALERLSPREREVLFQVLEGHSNKVIAHHFGITDAEAKTLLETLLHKIKVNNRTQAAVWALLNCPSLMPALSPSSEWQASSGLVAVA